MSPVEVMGSAGVAAPPPAAFDAIAAEYDSRFSDHSIARRLRARVWRAAEMAFPPGGSILDIGCGTGIDAWHMANRGFHVVGIDPSAAMVAVARGRAARPGLIAPRFVVGTLPEWAAEFAQPAASAVGHRPPEAETALPRGASNAGTAAPTTRFHGALADFGSLNAVPDLPALGTALAALLRPGAPVVAVVMGPFCAWETAVHGSRGDWRRATRRWRTGGAAADLGAGLFTVRYPGPRALARALGPAFRLRHHGGLGVALPPTWAATSAGWLASRPHMLALVDRLDAALGALPASSYAADHYVAVFERRP